MTPLADTHAHTSPPAGGHVGGRGFIPPRRILLIHQNFPGQFGALARAWSDKPGILLVGLGRETAPGMPGVAWQRYGLHRPPAKVQHPYLRQMENAVLHGQAGARALSRLARQGFTPDVVVAHSGWANPCILNAWLYLATSFVLLPCLRILSRRQLF